ncbi:DNA internalization-related competence protein ComEC/Rec2 [Vibrio rhizosphaerae]|uniref:DNA internalization-related competence protein ComEC/Rec2 n=1 Tax=Vibrio rhizosphaerae TaxID=398736 RepID=A0ABU4ITQ0_9VIBR|nr:DNA internalization-related competence protein ComEC/Rec2 [Vibrio rhizosphaerae]MDW6092654.1 DNA internalization-related competence protein ComEC/Rec2 [Vibrio rhizosphaerae]
MVYCWWGVLLLLLFFALRIHQLWYTVGVCIALILVLLHGNIFKRQSDVLFQSPHDTTINVKVDSFFTPNSFGYSARAQVLSINNTPIKWWIQPKVKLYTSAQYYPGDILKMSVAIKPITGLLNEAGFDSERYFFSQGIVAKVFARSDIVVKKSGDSWRYRLFQRVAQQLQSDSLKGIILALSFANRNDLTEQQWRLFQESGLAHLIAISGLHIGIAYSFGFLLGLPLSRLGQRWLWTPVILGTCSAWIYAWLAGFSLPTQRAMLMLLIHIVFRLSHIRISLSSRFLITLCGILTIHPLAGVSASFWMSFAAVSFVLYLVNQERDVLHRDRLGKLLRQIKGHVVLMVCMLPVSAYFFGGVSLAAPLYNLVFIPWFSVLVVPLLFIGLVITVCGGPAMLIWQSIHVLLEPVMWAASFAEPAWLFTPAYFIYLLFMATALVLLWPVLSCHSRSFFLMMMCGFAVGRETTKNWQIDILDVGHGLSILVERNEHYVLYDTGKSWPGGSIVQSVVTPVLRQRGVRRLDGLILSHLDNDHAGGRFDLDKIWHPQWKRASASLPGYQPCTQGHSWQWQALTFDVLWPPQRVVKAGNDDSCTIRISDDAGHSILLTGDIEKDSERQMLQQNLPIGSDVVIVPHHGSYTSSTPLWVKRVGAEFAIASLAGINPWHLPNHGVVKRYQQNGTQWLDTATSGQIRIIISNKKREINTMRSHAFSPWYRQMLRKQVEWRGYSR